MVQRSLDVRRYVRRNRTEFLGLLVTMTTASLFVMAEAAIASQQVPQVPLAGRTLAKFVDPLPVFVTSSQDLRVKGTNLVITMEEFQQKILPSTFVYPADFTGGTWVWGYKIIDGGTTRGPHYPGFTVEAQRNVPTTVKYVNNLHRPDGSPPILQSYLTTDQSIHWADPLGCMMAMPGCGMMPYAGARPAVAHLHGGEVPSAFDGGPDSWFTPGLGIRGSGFVSDTYTYPNGQEPATLWYHDHALGVTRLNVYGGLAAFYLLRGGGDTGVGNALKLPAGDKEIELAIQDKQFDTNGQLYYPDVGLNLMDHPFWQPEFFGDVIVVNGKTWPYLNVEPRRYRFRMVDGSNARFYELRLMDRTCTVEGPPMYQIGTDGGLMDKPAVLNDPQVKNSPRLVLGPGERADIIVDFSGMSGKTFTLVNSAKAPYPAGTPADPSTVGQIMQFRVNLPLSGVDTTFNPALPGATLRGGAGQPAAVTKLANGVGGLGAGVSPDAHRQLTLNEVMGMGGPLEVLLNNSKWGADVTEQPQVGATEIWEIINLTADAHPMHLHLVQFQLVNRQAFNASKYMKAYDAAFTGGVFMPSAGPPLPYNSGTNGNALGGNPDVTPFLQDGIKLPGANEVGWKDTVKMFPGQVTRIVVRMAPQDVAVDDVSAGENWFPFDPTADMDVEDDGYGSPGGPGYVWHCHIVDHEDNEMMRPLKVTP